jgi:hypothetical protein
MKYVVWRRKRRCSKTNESSSSYRNISMKDQAGGWRVRSSALSVRVDIGLISPHAGRYAAMQISVVYSAVWVKVRRAV